MQKIAVIGAGMMGSGIAAMAALAGRTVTLTARSEASARRGRENALACLAQLAANGLDAHSPDAAGAPARILYAKSNEEAVQGAQMVVEAISEDLGAKQALFEQLDELLDADVPIVSNTSGMRITDIAARVRRYPQRTMTAHFWLPAHLVPLVEIVLWEKTDRAMALAVREELRAWDKQPVLVNRDLPGQLANRILQAVIREASNIVASGLASAEDVDTAVKAGMGLRFPAWGPLEHVDAVGLDLCLSVQENVLPGLDNGTDNAAMRRLVAQGQLGHKTRHGFYDWTQKDMDALVRRRDACIIAARRALQNIHEGKG